MDHCQIYPNCVGESLILSFGGQNCTTCGMLSLSGPECKLCVSLKEDLSRPEVVKCVEPFMVYITRTGTRYHLKPCGRERHHVQKFIRVSLSSIGAEMKPCHLCAKTLPINDHF